MRTKFDDRGFAGAEKRLKQTGVDIMRGSGAEMQQETQSRVRVDTGSSRRMVTLVPTPNGAMVVGESDVLFFHEYGTGQYHEGGGGRQDPWVYMDRNGNFWTTTGVTPNPAFRPGFERGVEYFKREKRRRGL